MDGSGKLTDEIATVFRIQLFDNQFCELQPALTCRLERSNYS